MPPPLPRKVAWFAPLLVLLGGFGFAAAWVLLAYARNDAFSWLAVLAALDIALLLRMGRLRPGWRRACWGVAATALTIVAASWGIIAAQVGKPMGLLPWESVRRMGLEHAWLLAQLSNDAVDLAWFGAALLIAAVVSR